jgi:hypothetical protein
LSPSTGLNDIIPGDSGFAAAAMFCTNCTSLQLVAFAVFHAVLLLPPTKSSIKFPFFLSSLSTRFFHGSQRIESIASSLFPRLWQNSKAEKLKQ